MEEPAENESLVRIRPWFVLTPILVVGVASVVSEFVPWLGAVLLIVSVIYLVAFVAVLIVRRVRSRT